jgi:hypothetical protein
MPQSEAKDWQHGLSDGPHLPQSSSASRRTRGEVDTNH